MRGELQASPFSSVSCCDLSDKLILSLDSACLLGQVPNLSGLEAVGVVRHLGLAVESSGKRRKVSLGGPGGCVSWQTSPPLGDDGSSWTGEVPALLVWNVQGSLPCCLSVFSLPRKLKLVSKHSAAW